MTRRGAPILIGPPPPGSIPRPASLRPPGRDLELGNAFGLIFPSLPVDEIVFWVPHPVSLGIGMSTLNYAGRVTVGVMTDAGGVSTPSILTDHFRAEFEALIRTPTHNVAIRGGFSHSERLELFRKRVTLKR